MFKVRTIESKEEQKNLCSVCSTEYIPSSFAYGAFDIDAPDSPNEETIGICQFSFSETCEIHCLVPAEGKDTDEAILILGFAVLEFLRRCGYSEVTADIPSAYALRLGFIKKDDKYSLDLTAGRACGGH